MPIIELTELDTLIDELDERITGSDLPTVEASDSLACTVIICNSTLCGSALNC
ncbi:hypothetical protein OHU11_28040 [Streptomyces sp. NBC_00257]|uniref:hypothetical protein n=1 Tax=Streptomyces TaxID=1883 RepID=UPI002257F898|nr:MULTISPECIES: hypothetical protein [unclassified Streptomyces]WTB54441.1 hypothetical protein OG832_15325 [Streptomyces sp. NBC_00826]WTH92672.1 hypothetical protein OIC43_28355 [Streptomyces sp. NBC_00825]WTI01403.1 hypothetical protein OHA23_28335 [Streptomyces sp. NBC_00822]MCX4866988.1 hypothetical protein [Streptomyces sp. NBC_00906]MCX4898226.1 hypothetical protein [Streptomyces sp. NBC_00892]